MRPIYQFSDQNQAQNTNLDSATAYKSKQHPTAHKSKQQPKSSLKAGYESKIRFKIMNLIKNWKN